MAGWTTKPRKAGAGCHCCGQERGATVLALSARLGRGGGPLWLCAGCATAPAARRAFIDEYARRAAAVAVPVPRRDEQ